MQTAEKVVTNIIPTTEVIATTGTVAWMEALYEAGAVSFGPEGHFSVNPEVRHAISAMHAILAGGVVSIKIVNEGGNKYVELEKKFDLACEEASSAHTNRSSDDDVTLPVGP